MARVIKPGGNRHGRQLVARARPAPVTAVLDEAHLGDIQGALGTIRVQDVGSRRSWRARLLTLAAIVGPGIIVMVGDNDAGGVATYSQAGQNYGTSLLWTLILLIPVLIVNQEMVVRLGAVTGVGHARLIRERFGRFWGLFSVGDLFVLDFLTIVTEFIGVDLALSYFGVSKYLSVPLAALGLIAITISGSFRRWERFMLVFVAANLLVIPLVVMSHPRPAPIAHGIFVPGIQGGVTSTSILLIIAIVGTTVAPWQLFFQQSSIVDKRITPRWINYERADTVLGSVRHGPRRRRHGGHLARSPSSTPRSPAPSLMPRESLAAFPTSSVTRRAPCTRSSSSTHPSSGPPQSRSARPTRSVTSSVPATRCTAACVRPLASTPVSPGS